MKSKLSIAIGIGMLGLGPSAFAVTDSDVNSVIPFNLANPGARSIGMGGAFLGLSDDATAAYTNPAGLTQLSEAEVSIEGRHTKYSVPFVNGGSTPIDPFDTETLHAASASNSINNMSFLSIVYPHERWAFALFRDEVINYKNTFEGSLEPETIDFGSLGTFDVFPIAGNQSVKVVDYGFSVALKVNDGVSLGAGLNYYRFDIDSIVGRFSDTQFFSNPGEVLNLQQQSGKDEDYGLNLGARFTLTEQWSVGLAYRMGPRFNYQAVSAIVAQPVGNDQGTFTATPVTPPQIQANLNKVGFKIPDVYAIGLSWRPNDSWRVNFDFDEVVYSQVTHNMQSLFGYGPETVGRLVIPNGQEFHLGAEYTFAQMSHPISVRAGVWHDPRHSIEYRGQPITDPSLNSNPAVAAVAVIFGVSQGSQNHGAIGAGMAFKQFQIDFGADFSDLSDTYSLSAVWRF
jgi:long-subunit fatty acid transport protein